MAVTTRIGTARPSLGLGLAAVLVVAELLFTSLLFKHAIDFSCLDNAPRAFCQFFSGMVVGGAGAIAMLVLFSLMARKDIAALLAGAGQRGWPLLLNLLGFAVILVPVLFLRNGVGQSALLWAAFFWLAGAALAAAGIVLYLATAGDWGRFLRAHGARLVPMLLIGFAAPYLSMNMRPIWRVEAISSATFDLVVMALRGLGYAIHADPVQRIVGIPEFSVQVSNQCSGVEGFALMALFVTVYLALFRRELRFPQALLLYPLGLLVSGLLNVVRIAVLLVLGFEGHPELAVGGFHSHAGWLMFTIVSLGVVMLANSSSFFHRRDLPPAAALGRPPFLRDPAVAQILPFLVFMATAILSSTFSATPSLYYPLRMVAVGAALALVWPYLRQLPWRFDPLAALSGLAIGALWIATGPAPSGAPPFGDLTGLAFAVWVLARVIGTSVFVPILEELMFRSYIQGRIAPEGAASWRVVLAVSVATLLFAALHDRWIAAALAGLVFSALMLRSRNITDPILSHALANLTIALWALATGAWHIL